MADWSAAFAVVAAAVTISHATDSPRANTPQTHTVTIENMQFNPAVLTVRRGDRVVWTNKDLFPHTASAANHDFASGDIASNESWHYVAVETGEYDYVCLLHPTMKAKLRVD